MIEQTGYRLKIQLNLDIFFLKLALADSCESLPAKLLTVHTVAFPFLHLTSLNSMNCRHMNLCTDQSWKHISRYEFTLIVAFGWVPFFIAKTTLQTFYHANIGYLRNWKMFMLAYGFEAMLFCIGDAGYNYLWIHIFGFFPPKPFGGYTVGSLIIPLVFAMFWFRIPKSARKEKELKKRFVVYLVSRVYDTFVVWVYTYAALLFIHIPSAYQPILGFFSPLLREIIQKTLNFITHRAGGGRHVKMGMFFLKSN